MVIKSAGGSTIIQMSWDGPNHMNDDGTIYSWHVDFTYDGSLYGQLPSCTAYPYDSC